MSRKQFVLTRKQFVITNPTSGFSAFSTAGRIRGIDVSTDDFISKPVTLSPRYSPP